MTNTIEAQLDRLAKKLDFTIHQLLWENGVRELDVDQSYDDMLDDVYPMVEVCGASYFPSSTLKELDPTAYRCGRSDYMDSNFYQNEDYISFDGGDTYYSTSKVESLIEELEQEEGE